MNQIILPMFNEIRQFTHHGKIKFAMHGYGQGVNPALAAICTKGALNKQQTVPSTAFGQAPRPDSKYAFCSAEFPAANNMQHLQGFHNAPLPPLLFHFINLLFISTRRFSCQTARRLLCISLPAPTMISWISPLLCFIIYSLTNMGELFMTSPAWQGSLLFRLVAGLAGTFRQSTCCGWLTDTTWPERSRVIRSSLFARMLTILACLLLRPLLLAGTAIRRGLPGSFLVNLSTRPFWKKSFILTSIAQIRVETVLLLVIGYPVVDFLLRNSRFMLLAGYWDEILFILIVLAWPIQMALRGKLFYRLTPMDMPILFFIAVVAFLFSSVHLKWVSP